MTQQEQDQLAEDHAEHKWDKICYEQHWDTHAKVIHLESFIRNKALMGELAVYARQMQIEEKAEYAVVMKMAAHYHDNKEG